MAYKILTTKQFDKAAKLCQKRGLPMHKLTNAMRLLSVDGKMSPSYHPHKLKGNYSNVWECHLQPDWLLLWKQDNNKLTLLFTHTGSHADIF